MATLFMGGVFQAINASGVAPFAELETYAAGTLTPLATFTDAGGLSSNPTTVICNAAGQANVWLGTAAYRFRLYTATTAGRVLIYDTDNVQSSLAAILVSLAASGGSALVGFLQGGAGAVPLARSAGGGLGQCSRELYSAAGVIGLLCRAGLAVFVVGGRDDGRDGVKSLWVGRSRPHLALFTG